MGLMMMMWMRIFVMMTMMTKMLVTMMVMISMTMMLMMLCQVMNKIEAGKSEPRAVREVGIGTQFVL